MLYRCFRHHELAERIIPPLFSFYIVFKFPKESRQGVPQSLECRGEKVMSFEIKDFVFRGIHREGFPFIVCNRQADAGQGSAVGEYRFAVLPFTFALRQDGFLSVVVHGQSIVRKIFLQIIRGCRKNCFLMNCLKKMNFLMMSCCLMMSFLMNCLKKNCLMNSH